MNDSVDSREARDRLSRISTHWNSVFRAHADTTAVSSVAKESVLQRYREPIYRYLLAVVRDADVAEELSQEFAVRFLWGSLHRAAPERGRFRDYIKTVVVNMARAHFSSQQQRPRQLSELTEPFVMDDELKDEGAFDEYLRTHLLNSVWTSLEEARPKYFKALNMRATNPELSSRAIAEVLTQSSGTPINRDKVRKTIQRARVKFAELLVEAAAEALQCKTDDDLRKELKELRLLKYCSEALTRRKKS